MLSNVIIALLFFHNDCSLLIFMFSPIVCFEMQTQLVSVALAFLLIGYKGIREASTEFCFSKVGEFFKCTGLLLKRFIDGEYSDNKTDLTSLYLSDVSKKRRLLHFLCCQIIFPHNFSHKHPFEALFLPSLYIHVKDYAKLLVKHWLLD